MHIIIGTVAEKLTLCASMFLVFPKYFNFFQNTNKSTER